MLVTQLGEKSVWRSRKLRVTLVHASIAGTGGIIEVRLRIILCSAKLLAVIGSRDRSPLTG